MRWLTGCCAVLAMVLGWYVHASEGIPMQALPDGTLIYSLSAGSEDAQLLGAGLMAFGLTAVAAVLVGLRTCSKSRALDVRSSRGEKRLPQRYQTRAV